MRTSCASDLRRLPKLLDQGTLPALLDVAVYVFETNKGS